MTDADLVADLSRLLEDGLVYVDLHHGPRPLPRFALTARGRALSSAEGLFRDRPKAPPAAVTVGEAVE